MKSLTVAAFFVCCVGAVWASAPEFQTLPKEAELVRIDGAAITKGDVQRAAKAFMTLNMNKLRRTQIGSQDKEIYRRYCQTAVEKSINRATLERYAADHAVAVDTGMIARAERQVVRQYGVRSKKLKRWHTVDDLKYILGKNADILDREIATRARYNAVTNHILTSNPIVVTDAQISNRLAAIARANVIAVATNALVYARATNVWQQIVAKTLTFEEAATNYSEDIYLDMGCEWGMFNRDQLADDPEVSQLLPSLKVGDITPPVRSDGGLVILRLDAVEENKNFTFSRVFFRLPIIFHVESDDEARAFLQDALTREQLDNTLQATRAMLKIEYPSGTNLFAVGTSPLKLTKADFEN